VRALAGQKEHQKGHHPHKNKNEEIRKQKNANIHKESQGTWGMENGDAARKGLVVIPEVG
jgi:hypothetical protein